MRFQTVDLLAGFLKQTFNCDNSARKRKLSLGPNRLIVLSAGAYEYVRAS